MVKNSEILFYFPKHNEMIKNVDLNFKMIFYLNT